VHHFPQVELYNVATGPALQCLQIKSEHNVRGVLNFCIEMEQLTNTRATLQIESLQLSPSTGICSATSLAADLVFSGTASPSPKDALQIDGAGSDDDLIAVKPFSVSTAANRTSMQQLCGTELHFVLFNGTTVAGTARIPLYCYLRLAHAQKHNLCCATFPFL
jgi:hypothetical protein